MVGRLISFIRPRIALLFAIVAVAVSSVGLVAAWIYLGRIGTDFGVYWRTANLPLFWAYWHGHEFPFPYAPTMLLWISPLKLLPQWPAFAMWVALSVGAMACATRPYLTRRETILLLLSPPLVAGFATGQVSVVLASLMLWAIGTPSRLVAGIAFGVIASIKPQLVVMAPLLFVLNGDWRAIFGAVITLTGIVIAALLSFGTSPWLEWVGSLSDFRFTLNTAGIIGASPSLAGQAEWWGFSPVPFLILGTALGVALVAACRNGSPMEKCAAIGAGSILASPYALTYDLAPVMPFLVWCVFRNRIAAGVAFGAALNPLPVILTAAELLRRARWNTKTAMTAECPGPRPHYLPSDC